MPAIDQIEGKVHIPDRNHAKPTSTLCGLKLASANFYSKERNFEQATCVTCQSLFFKEIDNEEA